MTGPGDAYALAQEFLSACEDALDTIPTLEPGLVGSPARAFVSPGQSADDCCPQLTVWIGPVVEKAGFSRNPDQDCPARINIVTLTARIIRCVDAEGNPPDYFLLESSARQIDADGWALWNHLYNLRCAGAFSTLCDSVTWQSLVPIVPSGGCGGWVLTATVQLDGYPETIASS
jgi:hypothetical protein